MLYTSAYNYFVEAVDRALVQKGFRPGLGRILVDLHLDERFYVMPISVDLTAQEQLLRDADYAGDLVASLAAAVHFEDVSTFGGVLRVFARTLLNRAGVADLGRGRTEANAATRNHIVPRIGRVLDALEAEPNSTLLVDYNYLLTLLASTAEFHLHSDGPQGLDAADLHAIQALHQAGAASTLQRVQEVARVCGVQGWAKWVRGLHSGINYLSETCGLDVARFRDILQDAIDSGPDGPLLLGWRYKCAVQEMGLPLALSFFGDLGNSEFAKPDRHVINALEAYEGHRSSPRRAFGRVQWHATEAGVTPRRLDKLFFLAGSGNFYLTGFNFGSAFKQDFLDHLRDDGDTRSGFQ